MSEIKIGDIVRNTNNFINEHAGNFICFIFPMIVTISTLIYIFFMGNKEFNNPLFDGIHCIIFIWGAFIWIILLSTTLYHILQKICGKIEIYYYINIKNIVLFKGKPEPKIDKLVIYQIKDEFGIEI